MANVALAWVLARVTAPVIGSTSIKNLEELISACNCYMIRLTLNFIADGTEITLTQEEIQYLDEPYKERSVMGHS
jgi:diketogulonate reductase-like aldo/keto reductase